MRRTVRRQDSIDRFKASVAAFLVPIVDGTEKDEILKAAEVLISNERLSTVTIDQITDLLILLKGITNMLV